VAWNGVAREPVDGHERGRGIARPSAEARAGRDPLGEGEVHPEPLAGRFDHRGGAPHREVLRRRPDVGVLHVDRDLASLPPLGAELVGKVHQTEQGLQPVEPVRLAREHPKEEVQLRVRPDPHRADRHASEAPRRSLSATGVRASDQAPANVIGRKVVP
jgi:hypothetical protein